MDYALLPKRNHGVKQRRRDGLAYNRYACRVDQQAGFDASSFRYGARCVIAGVVIPVWQCSQGVR